MRQSHSWLCVSESPADVEQLLESKEEVLPEEQDQDHHQEGSEPPHIKEEQEEFVLTPVLVKSEDNVVVKLQSAGEPEPDGDFGPDLRPDPRVKPKDSDGSWRVGGRRASLCSVCGKTFNSKGDLQIHSRSHSAGEPLSCSVCSKTFRHLGALTHHMVSHTSRKMRSNNSTKTLRSRGDAKLSQCLPSQLDQSEKQKNQLSCSECDAMFPNNYLLMSHIRTHRGKKLFSCSVCGATRHFSSQMEIHMRTHTGEKPYSCFICGKSFSQKGIMKQHMAVHSGVKPFHCSDCGRRFCWHFQIKRHKCPGRFSAPRGAEPVRSFNPFRQLEARGVRGAAADPQHNVDTGFWTDTRQHQSGLTYQRNKSDSVNRGLAAGCCHEDDDDDDDDTATPDAVNMEGLGKTRLHLNNPEGSDEGPGGNRKPLSCLFCGKAFTTGGHLTQHISVHTGLMLLTCIECERTFSSKSELLNHRCVAEASENQQSAEGKPDGCSGCADTLSRAEASHMTGHQTEKSFHCSVCNTDFSDSESLVKHMRIHTRQTQFSCYICHKEFPWRRCLSRHMVLHARQELPSCSPCEPDQLQYQHRDGDPSQLHQTETHELPHSGSTEQKTPEPDPQPVARSRDSAGVQTEANNGEGAKTDRKQLSCSKMLHTEEHLHRLRSHHNQNQNRDQEYVQLLHAPVLVKSEDVKGEKPGTTEEPEPDGDSGPDGDSSVDSDFWKENRERPSDLSSCRNTVDSESEGSDTNVATWSELTEHSDPNRDEGDSWTDDRKQQENKRRFSCSECRKRFSYIHHLNNHLKLHRRQRDPFYCAVCGHKYLYESHLKIHMRTHTGEKPFGCPLCGKKYAHKASMQSHMQVHKVEQQYSCSTCGRGFAWYTELKYHRCTGPEHATSVVNLNAPSAACWDLKTSSSQRVTHRCQQVVGLPADY